MNTKTFTALFFTILLAPYTTASAANTACGLPDSYDSDTFKPVGNQKYIKEGMSLIGAEAAEIMITARNQEKRNKDGGKLLSVGDAIKYLAQEGGGDDGTIGNQIANGVVYTVVVYYPGDNSVGLIFAENSANVIGYIEDTDVKCAR